MLSYDKDGNAIAPFQHDVPADMADASIVYLGKHAEYSLYYHGNSQKLAAVSFDDVVTGMDNAFDVPVLYVALGRAYMNELVTDQQVMAIRQNSVL